MSAQAPRAVIDSLEFARTGQILRGSVPVSEFTRLHDSLYDTLGRVEYGIQGGEDSRRRPVLRLNVGGWLHLRCQRCLGRLDLELDLDATLVLQVVAPEAPDDGSDDDESDSIDPQPQLDVAGLVEDEIILSIPYSPRHADGACQAGSMGVARADFEPALGKLAVLKQEPD